MTDPAGTAVPRRLLDDGRFRLVLAAILFSTGGAIIKSTSLTAWQVAAVRSGIAALTLVALLPGARRGWTWRTLVGGAAYAMKLALLGVASQVTAAAKTS